MAPPAVPGHSVKDRNDGRNHAECRLAHASVERKAPHGHEPNMQAGKASDDDVWCNVAVFDDLIV